MVTRDQVQQLTLPEKISLMEDLWEEITASTDSVEVPLWHKTLLDEREELIKKGEATFIDWETAKAQIQKEIA